MAERRKLNCTFGMIGQQRHGHGACPAIRFEIMSVVSRMPNGLSCVPGVPDRDLLGLPGLDAGPTVTAWVGTFCTTAAARGARVLDDRHRVQVDDARAQLAILGRRRRRVRVRRLALGRVVEGPVLDLALAALHHHAARLRPSSRCTPRGSAAGKWRFSRGMRSSGRMRLKHSSRSARAKLSGKSTADLFAVDHPFVHAPEVGVPQVRCPAR